MFCFVYNKLYFIEYYNQKTIFNNWKFSLRISQSFSAEIRIIRQAVTEWNFFQVSRRKNKFDHLKRMFKRHIEYSEDQIYFLT